MKPTAKRKPYVHYYDKAGYPDTSEIPPPRFSVRLVEVDKYFEFPALDPELLFDEE